MALIGFLKSSSFMPVARHSARAPAMLTPWVEVLERASGMGLAYQFAAKAAALCWECRARFDERRGSRFGERLLAEGQYCSSPGGLQVLLEHLGVALVVVQLGTLLGQALHRAGLEAAF